MIEDILVLIGNFGFPIVISGYLLIRFEAKLEALTEGIYHLTEVMNQIV